VSGIYWLASYPKSGNTWMRVFLTNYRRRREGPVDINDLAETRPVSLRLFFDDMLGIDSSLLTHSEVDGLRPAVYRKIAKDLRGKDRYFKIHDAFRRLPDGAPNFPADVTAGVVYIVRTPLDVVVSYAHHNRSSIDQAIGCMASDEHGLFMTKTTRTDQLHQPLLSWSNHVRSWVDGSGLRLHIVRYEDMVGNATGTFTGVIRFVGAEERPDRIEKAIRFSSFEELQRQEHQHGFKEKAHSGQSFFRKGQVGAWRDALSAAQVSLIVDRHREMMQRFGYLSESGEIID